MEILTLNSNEINQNGYHINKLTRNKIGFIYIAPANIIPDDCLACDGYILKISDYKKLYSAIGKTYNTGVENDDEFRIPDYNITGRFLQPGTNIGIQIAAGLPQHTHSGTTSSNGAHTHTAQSAGAHTHTINEGHSSQGLSSTAPYTSGDDYTSTVWKTQTTSSSGAHTHTTNSTGAHTHTMTTGNASNGTYGKSSTVQPPSQIVHLCIKYK